MYQAFLFNLQVRYALGYEQFGEGYFAMRTVYELRRRLSKWMQQTGENLIEAAFVQNTDAQLETLKLKSETLRMDSNLVASDICNFTRLTLSGGLVQLSSPKVTSRRQCRRFSICQYWRMKWSRRLGGAS